MTELGNALTKRALEEGIDNLDDLLAILPRSTGAANTTTTAPTATESGQSVISVTVTFEAPPPPSGEPPNGQSAPPAITTEQPNEGGSPQSSSGAPPSPTSTKSLPPGWPSNVPPPPPGWPWDCTSSRVHVSPLSIQTPDNSFVTSAQTLTVSPVPLGSSVNPTPTGKMASKTSAASKPTGGAAGVSAPAGWWSLALAIGAAAGVGL